MASIFLYVAETVDSIRSKYIGYLQAAGSTFSNWIAGGIGQQMIEASSNVVQEFTQIAAKAVRGFASLDTSTDPGDYDPYDPTNQTLPFTPGLLSDLGSNVYGTERVLQGAAVGPLTFNNSGTGAVNQNLPAFSVSAQRNYANADGTYPLYRNSAAIVCNAGQTVTVPIVAESPGSAYGATATSIDSLINSLPGVTVSNPDQLVGTDLQSANDYRAACREAASLTSPNGPSDSYEYLAKTGRDDGTWGNSTTGNPLGITRVYVSQDSSTGIVAVYYAGASGGSGLTGAIPNASGPFQPGVTTYVQAANYLITQTPGVIAVPDAMTFTGQAATDDTYNITYSLKLPASSVPGAVPGTYTYTTGDTASSPASAAALKVFQAIDTSYANFMAGKDIGGDDQTAGTGVIYTEDLRGVLYLIQLNVGQNLPTRAATVTVPSGSTTTVNVGHDAVYGTGTGTLYFT